MPGYAKDRDLGKINKVAEEADMISSIQGRGPNANGWNVCEQQFPIRTNDGFGLRDRDGPESWALLEGPIR